MLVQDVVDGLPESMINVPSCATLTITSKMFVAKKHDRKFVSKISDLICRRNFRQNIELIKFRQNTDFDENIRALNFRC